MLTFNHIVLCCLFYQDGLLYMHINIINKNNIPNINNTSVKTALSKKIHCNDANTLKEKKSQTYYLAHF